MLPYKKGSGSTDPWEDTPLLKTLTRLHTPDLLHLLASMGHGDELALVDCHFPAVSNARRLVRLDGADLPDALSACLQLMPLDTFVKDPALRMEVADAPDQVPEVQKPLPAGDRQVGGPPRAFRRHRAARLL